MYVLRRIFKTKQPGDARRVASLLQKQAQSLSRRRPAQRVQSLFQRRHYAGRNRHCRAGMDG